MDGDLWSDETWRDGHIYWAGNFKGTATQTATGFPPAIAGLMTHCCAAATAGRLTREGLRARVQLAGLLAAAKKFGELGNLVNVALKVG